MVYALIFSFTGILLGWLLAKIAPEELKHGQKYFELLKKWFFITIVLAGLILMWKQDSWLWFFIILILAIGIYITHLKLKNFPTTLFEYLYFILIYVATQIQNGQFFLAALIFLYGFPIGLMIEKLSKTKKHD
ncbi:hypothetical protein COV12_01235 [Candidatus Woesearchaeota archaeon CG10_big_fil_rev_8_21_14_0_10_32_24]|nr:MAG: hypothetical protein COV12_01235 [Candidatus Woesearchaeota archaeon CG10_big_fil_rev_8_21_14_0_10_32_24]